MALLFIPTALPRPKLKIEAQSPVFPGDVVAFKCEFKSSVGWKYKWYKHNGPRPVAASDTPTRNQSVDETDEGVYWCQGERTDRATPSQRSQDDHLHIIRKQITSRAII